MLLRIVSAVTVMAVAVLGFTAPAFAGTPPTVTTTPTSEYPASIVATADGAYVYTGTRTQILRTTTATGVTTLFAAAGAEHLVLSPNGALLYARGDGSLYRFNTTTGAYSWWDVGNLGTHTFAISPSGTYAYVPNQWIGVIYRIYLGDPKPDGTAVRQKWAAAWNVSELVASPDGNYLYSQDPDKPSIRRFSAIDGQVTDLAVGVGGSHFVYSNDGSTLYAASGQNVVSYDASSGSELQHWPIPAGVSGLAVNADRTAVYVTHESVGTLTRIMTATGYTTIWTLGGSPRAVAAAGTSTAYVAYYYGNVLKTVVMPAQANVPDKPTFAAVSPDDGGINVIAALGSDGGEPITGVDYSLDNGATWTVRGDTEPAFLIAPATNNQTYILRIRAHNDVGNSLPSDPLTVTVGIPPAPPTVTSTTGGLRSFVVHATIPSPELPVTDVQVSVDGSTWRPASVDESLSTVTVTNVDAGTYSVRVRSRNAVRFSDPSEPVPVTVRDVPTAPSLVSVVPGLTSIDVTVLAGTSRGSVPTGYQYSLDAGANWVPTSSLNPMFTITGLAPWTLYSLQVRTMSGDGPSLASPVANVHTLAPAPPPAPPMPPALPQPPPTPVVAGCSLSVAAPSMAKRMKRKGRTVVVASASVSPGCALSSPTVLATAGRKKAKVSVTFNRTSGRVTVRTFGQKKVKVLVGMSAHSADGNSRSDAVWSRWWRVS